MFCFFNFIIANTWELEYHCTDKTKEKTEKKRNARRLQNKAFRNEGKGH